MRRVACIALAAACYAPDPQPGNPCTGDDCPAPLVCSEATMTCERTNTPVDARPDSYREGCAPVPELCGDGTDQDCDGGDPACAANDTGAGALDITAGGMFTGDLLLGRDDIGAPPCGGSGGRDLFYKVVLGAPQVYYFDTFGSTFDSVIRVYAGACTAVTGAQPARACEDDSCGGARSQLAVSLPAGESCIVIDQASGAEATGALVLRVVRGGRDGFPLLRGLQVNTGDTCMAANTTEPLDMNCDGPGAGGRDHAYFFTSCPGESLLLDAETCNATTNFDSVLYVKRVNGTQLGCSDDACGDDARITNVPINSSTLYWLYVDGFSQIFCGPYQLMTDLREPQ